MAILGIFLCMIAWYSAAENIGSLRDVCFG
jgi:hypothetical protein